MESNPTNQRQLRRLAIVGSILALVAVLVLAVGIAMVMSSDADNSTAITALIGLSASLTAIAGARIMAKSMRGENWMGEYDRASADLRFGAIASLVVVLGFAIFFLATGTDAVHVLLPGAVALQGPVALAIAAGYLHAQSR